MKRSSCTQCSESYGRIRAAVVVFGGALYLCYVDESGDSEPLNFAHQNPSPVFVLAGLAVPVEAQKSLTMDFLRLKAEFEPRLAKGNVKLSELIRSEVKGASLRKDIRTGGRRNNRRAHGILDKTLDLVTKHEGHLMAKVLIKDPAARGSGSGQYGRAIADLTANFQDMLERENKRGLMILDSRTKVKNESVVQAITTRRFAKANPQFDRVLESPVFGHSDAHVPLQIIDIIASALIYPMSCVNWCCEEVKSNLDFRRFEDIARLHSPKLRSLECAFRNQYGAKQGGFHLFDQATKRAKLFFPPDSPLAPVEAAIAVTSLIPAPGIT